MATSTIKNEEGNRAGLRRSFHAYNTFEELVDASKSISSTPIIAGTASAVTSALTGHSTTGIFIGKYTSSASRIDYIALCGSSETLYTGKIDTANDNAVTYSQVG